nr:acyl-homoserine-lactone synthase [Sphingopyxis panaciterrulae]
MLLTVGQNSRDREHVALRSMFAARKRVFVDLLKWDLPVLAGQYEVDHFDDVHATYLIVTDDAGEHLASARLLPTTRPALLDSLFPFLVAGPVPQGERIAEITRFCLSRDASARERRVARDTLLVGLVEHALANGVDTYTGVAELSWFRQIQTFGWRCRQLGEACEHDGRLLVGLRIDIDNRTAALLASAGIRAASNAVPAAAQAA